MKAQRHIARLIALSRTSIVGTVGTIIDGISSLHNSNAFENIYKKQIDQINISVKLSMASTAM